MDDRDLASRFSPTKIREEPTASLSARF